jgi:proteasome inhibitor subunit 1 (PI31)
MSNILDPSAITALLPTLLPPNAKKLGCSNDGIAALLHTAMAAVGFRLIAVDDSSPALPELNNVLPEEWNKFGPGNYTFRYRHNQSSLEFVLKVAKLGGRSLVNAIAVEVCLGWYFLLHLIPFKSDKTASLDIPTNDFVSPSFYPHDLTASDAPPLVHGFISSNRITDLMSLFKLQILQKLVPGLRKEGYTEEISDSSTSTLSSNTSTSTPHNPRPHPQPPPDAPEYLSQPHIPPQNPLEVGRRDLDPIPMNPFAPPPLFPPFNNDGDGMYVGPDHPIFGARRGGRAGDRGPWGGDGFLPPMGAPPGARFDPVGPDVGGIGGLGRGRGRGGPGARNIYGPDNDEFMPPGMVRVLLCLSSL